MVSNSDRPYIICHMMTTIDGKIASGVKDVNIFDDYYNTYSQLEQTYEPHAWLCGRVTSEQFADVIETPLPEITKVVQMKDFKSTSKEESYLFLADIKGKLRWKGNTIIFGDKSVHQLVIVVTKHTPQEYIAYLQHKDISYIFAGEKEINFVELFKKLKSDYQVDTLVLEGGALLNGSVMVEDFIDEISLLLTPLVLNKSDSPSLFERNSEKVILKQYNLDSVKKLENDCVWLKYKKI